MNELICKLSELECIKFVTKNNIDFKKVDFCCTEIKAYFMNNDQLCIGQQSAGEFFEPFISCLKKAIDNKLQLDESITESLGFMENERSGKSNSKNIQFTTVPSPSGKSFYWIGLNYQVWATFANSNPYVHTWLYNDSEGNIIFEVTPFYTWSMREQEPDDLNFITYDEFIKDYTSLIKRVIPRDTAIVWLADAMKVYKSFFKKDEKNFIRACNEMGIFF